jgi:hypothetical protein
MLDIVERVVDKESQFWDYTHLVSYTSAKLISYLLAVGVDV